jgi:hypothetical protein
MPKFKVGDIFKQINNACYQNTVISITPHDYEVKYTKVITSDPSFLNDLNKVHMRSIAYVDIYCELVTMSQQAQTSAPTNARFAKGSIIKPLGIAGEQSKITQVGNHNYELEVTASNHGKIGDKWVDTILHIDKYYEAVGLQASAILHQQPEQPQFGVGNLVITKWNNELRITTVDSMAQRYYYRILKSNNPLKVGATDLESFENAHKTWKLKTEALKKEVIGNPYNCECGAWKLRNIKPGRSHSQWCKLYRE